MRFFSTQSEPDIRRRMTSIGCVGGRIRILGPIFDGDMR